jgi:hypothetical protein
VNANASAVNSAARMKRIAVPANGLVFIIRVIFYVAFQPSNARSEICLLYVAEGTMQ